MDPAPGGGGGGGGGGVNDEIPEGLQGVKKGEWAGLHGWICNHLLISSTANASSQAEQLQAAQLNAQTQEPGLP